MEHRNRLYFDEKIFQSKIIEINTKKDAVLYHVMCFRTNHLPSNSTDLTISNDYRAKYFQQTLAALKQRKLHLLVELPPWASSST